MELLPVVMTFVLAYGLFLFVAYVLARIFFPSQETESEVKPKRNRKRMLKRVPSH